jgi:hypothetical protein
MSDIQIFDKVIPKLYSDQIEEDLLRTTFPWYYINDVTNMAYGDNGGLVHVAYNMGDRPSEWFPFIKPLVYSIVEAAGHNLTQLLRVRVGFLHPSANSNECNSPHLDFNFPHYTACYYVNDSDGATVLYKETANDVGADLTEENLKQYTQSTQFHVEQTCSPQKGRVCVFDGYRFHASSRPKVNNRRLVITVNYVS